MDLPPVRPLLVTKHGLEPFVRGIQLRLKLGWIALVDAFPDFAVFGHHVVAMLFDISRRRLDLISRQTKPERNVLGAPTFLNIFQDGIDGDPRPEIRGLQSASTEILSSMAISSARSRSRSLTSWDLATEYNSTLHPHLGIPAVGVAAERIGAASDWMPVQPRESRPPGTSSAGGKSLSESNLGDESLGQARHLIAGAGIVVHVSTVGIGRGM